MWLHKNKSKVEIWLEKLVSSECICEKNPARFTISLNETQKTQSKNRLAKKELNVSKF